MGIGGAKEVELDAVASNGTLVNYAIAEHVENAGIHSGDASLLLPAQKLFVETHRRVKSIGENICRALRISGPPAPCLLSQRHTMCCFALARQRRRSSSCSG